MDDNAKRLSLLLLGWLSGPAPCTDIKLILIQTRYLSCNTLAAIIVPNVFDLTPSQNIYYFFSEVIYYCWRKTHYKIIFDKPSHVFNLTSFQNNYYSFSETAHQAMEVENKLCRRNKLSIVFGCRQQYTNL